MLLIEPISAITSWEDYEYQGHVALYIALKSILDLLQNGKSISGYDLQIEGEEDFSIRKDSKYISLHQVKAGAIRLEQNDKFSFVIEILQNEAEYGYFHIANGKRIPVDFVSSTLTLKSLSTLTQDFTVAESIFSTLFITLTENALLSMLFALLQALTSFSLSFVILGFI